VNVAFSGFYAAGLDTHTTPTTGTTGFGSLTTAWLEEVGLPRLRAALYGTAVLEGHTTNTETQDSHPKRKNVYCGGKWT